MTAYDKPLLLDVEPLKPPCMPMPSINIRKNADGSVTCGASIDISSIATEYARYIGKTLDAEVLRVLEESYGFVKVVRCRDCKHYFDHEWVLVTDVSDVCHFWADGVKVAPDGFCKWGERRTQDA